MLRPTTTPYAGTNDFESRTTQNQEGENDEYMDINYMVKAQSIIESQAQGELKSSLFANPVRTAGVVLTKTNARPPPWPPPESRTTPIQVGEEDDSNSSGGG